MLIARSQNRTKNFRHENKNSIARVMSPICFMKDERFSKKDS